MQTLEATLKQAFDPFFQLSIDVWKKFAEYGSVTTVGKNDIIKYSGNTERYLSFILEGSGGIMLYKNDNYVCLDLCYENDFFGDYMSFLTQTPSPLEVITFEETTLFKISYSKFNELSQTQYGVQICKIAAESLFIHKQQQQIDLLMLTAEQRYQQLLQRQPHIIQRTPQKHIASYLGIIPESLSRIRKKFAP